MEKAELDEWDQYEEDGPLDLEDQLERALERAEKQALTPKPALKLLTVGVAQDVLCLDLREARECFERAYFQQKLVECGGCVADLARASGMERTHLYRKLRDLEVELPSQKTPTRRRTRKVFVIIRKSDEVEVFRTEASAAPVAWRAMCTTTGRTPPRGHFRIEKEALP